MNELIFMVQDSPEGGLEARALGHSIFIQGDTMSALRESAREAIACHFEPDEGPRVVRLHRVQEEVFAL
ncbi:MAG: 2-oxoisovalerate dehydrogenase [Fibrobacteres bacterium]|jgi:hypothetical protein|nr:2-oxoisovalerate dehydrogenase [Fibrobacterota bacterium]